MRLTLKILLVRTTVRWPKAIGIGWCLNSAWHLNIATREEHYKTMSKNPKECAPRTRGEQARLEQAIRDLFEHKIVFNEFLGFTMGKYSPGRVSVNFDMRPELIGHFMHGRLHGGVISAVLDAAGGLAVIWAIADLHANESADQVMQRFKALATIDIRVDYLRPGVGERFTAEANMVRLGRRIASTHSVLRSDNGKDVASANGAYIVSN